jgi:2-keto-4-pentenoate hydratase/2-oxohepta-3-ene-1,7-dioic acid hydratase in catechol pathway
MKVVRYQHDGDTQYGVLEGSAIRPAGTSLFELQPNGTSIPLDSVRLLAAVEQPSKIICVGLNYADHAEETGSSIPPAPILFTKHPSALTGHGWPVRIPAITSFVDYEAELAVVIGRRVRDVDAASALDYVFGYTCLNDVSARDLQIADGQWGRAKSFDTFGPLGPCITTVDEIPDVQQLRIRCLVNGEPLQDSSTSQMIFPVAELVSYISSYTTLEPGDIISTGTPAGVGQAREPNRPLRPGDTVTVVIDGIGELTNPVTDSGSED